MGKRFDRFKQGNFVNFLKKIVQPHNLAVLGGAATTAAGLATGNPALVGAGIPMTGAALTYAGAHEANEINREIAREQMGFQHEENAQQYQRTIADMEAAGINPNAIYSLGVHGSSPGASAQVGNEYAQAVHSAVALKQAQADIQKTRAETLLNSELARQVAFDISKTQAETDLKAHKVKQIISDIDAKTPLAAFGRFAGKVERAAHSGYHSYHASRKKFATKSSFGWSPPASFWND